MLLNWQLHAPIFRHELGEIKDRIAGMDVEEQLELAASLTPI